jgi:hypothetical protein
MQTFLINIFISVLTSPKVEALLAKLIGDAMSTVIDDIKAAIGDVETNLLGKVEALPAQILGDATKDVGVLLHEITGTTDDIAGAVKGQVSPLLDPVGFAKAIVAQMLGQGGNKPPWWPFGATNA